MVVSVKGYEEKDINEFFKKFEPAWKIRAGASIRIICEFLISNFILGVRV